MSFETSVQNLLDTKYLREITKVVAGEKGLSKNVSWVHILEIRDIIKECVNGNEMVLTTGIGFTSVDVAVDFLKGLIGQNVSALCIEMPLYYHKMDQELIDLANEHDFPLIEITQISRFIDITKDLNTMIIKNNADLYRDADNYEYQLKDIRGTLADGIRYTAGYLDLEVAYLPIKGEPYGSSEYLRNFIETKIEALNEVLKYDEIYCKGKIAIKHLEIYGKSWGYLVFNSTKREISQFDTLILNRLSSKIKHDIFEELVKKEEELYIQKDWIKEWLEGNLSQEIIKEKLKESGIYGNFKELLVCCTKPLDRNELKDDTINECSVDSQKSFEDFLLHMTIIVRRVFEEQGFSIVGYMQNNIISYIIMSPEGAGDVYERVISAIEQLRQYKDQFLDYKDSLFSIGRKVNKWTEVRRSYETAVEALKNMDQNRDKMVIYDRLYLNRIMSTLKDQVVLDEFISDYLGDLRDPVNVELLHTLKIYLELSCSKQKTADKLFIVRQTLYFRLQKIEDILGKNFDVGEKRLALEVAIYAYFYTLEKMENEELK